MLVYHKHTWASARAPFKQAPWRGGGVAVAAAAGTGMVVAMVMMVR